MYKNIYKICIRNLIILFNLYIYIFNIQKIYIEFDI